ncbi:DUF1692-domain-containing protein [Tricholoma matsutake]|nr:DUF1692-domain-containing protein [Tricholoma matsutake 945]
MEDPSILDKLDSVVPTPLAKFDAFPKLPSTYKSRSESRGFMTVFVALLALLLMLNDIGEYVWGWRDEEFSIDSNKSSYLSINVDISVAMPCKYLSVDLRDAVGDRLMLSGGLQRDGTLFDTSQAKAFKAHSEALSVRQAISQSRKSRGFFSFFKRKEPEFKPTYKHEAAGSACRIYGTLLVKRVTANLHITSLGHGYVSYEHVPHDKMNFSHVTNEFSFGPHFPDITQPLDYSFEVTNQPFTAYQYFLHVVPTTYIAPRSPPLRTNQYSVTHYKRLLDQHRGTPGIFFKFELDPLSITIHQRTTTFTQLLIRCVGVLGGVFVCMGYAIRITTRAVEVVSGADQAPGIVAAEASGVKVGLRSKWGGTSLRSRPKSTRMVPQGSGWVLESNGETTYTATTPMSNGYLTPGSTAHSPYLSAALPPSGPGTPGSGYGLPPSTTPGRSPSGLGPHWTSHVGPGAGLLPPAAPSPNENGNGFSVGSSPSRRSSQYLNEGDSGDAEIGIYKDD